MHPRNPYRIPPDFVSLAESYPPLKPHLIFKNSSATIDFKNDVSQRRLTEALLRRDFHLSLVIPEDRLCPPVPNRLNYILWLQDILEATSFVDPFPADRKIVGLDIGTGASAIYPLLGCRVDHWNFVATDIDEKSLKHARLNVQQNGLEDRITVVQSDPDGPIFGPLTSDSMVSSADVMPMQYDFTMCNPPFYSSRDDVLRSAEGKEFEPSAACTGADIEMITPGGEATFVRRMVCESLDLQTRCRWYTSMLGKMSSLTEVVALLRERQIDNYACTEFVQGQTRRWAIAWSFSDVRLPDSLGRISNPALQSIMPPRNTLQQSFPLAQSMNHLATVVAPVLAAIEGVSIRPLSFVGPAMANFTDVLVSAPHDSWSRAARRKKANSADMQTDSQPDVALVSRVTCVVQEGSGGGTKPVGGAVLQFNWVKGSDRALYESFASHVGRKTGTALASGGS